MGKEYERHIDLRDSNDHYTKMINLVGREKRVVDFGCSTGFISRFLKDRGCLVIGVEIDPVAAESAREVCDGVIVADLDDIDLVSELKGEKFDVGLFGDVIEHLKNPKRLLTQMRSCLAEGGYVVVSVPNIAHASIRLMLLQGRFDYEETGILDDNHLKYYTRESIGDFLESCGYMVDIMDWSEQAVSREDLHAVLDPLGLSNLEEVVKAFSSWESVAYQYVIKAFPANEEEQVRRLSEEKIQIERRLKPLERESEELKRLRPELEKARTYARGIEKLIDEKDEYIKMLENAVSERDRAIEEKDRNIEELASRVTELEGKTARPRARLPKRK
jgi:SAM-dependent methyltransferase